MTAVALPFHAHPDVAVVMVAVAVFFWWAFTRLGPSCVSAGEVVATRRQKQWVVAGIAWMFVWSYWPLHDISEKYLLLSHMTQHAVYTLVAPACLLMGTPNWLFSQVHRVPVLGPLYRACSKPLIALLGFNLLVAGTHFTQVVERSLHSEWFHFVVHLALFTAAICMWTPVINRTDGLPRLKTPPKMIYLFAQSIVPTVPASFLTFSKTALYPTYEAAPRFFVRLDAVEDQQIAAAIMKLGAGSFLWAIVGYLFYNWWLDSKAGRADDNILATPNTPVRIAGLTISGDRVDEQLDWATVKAELDRLDAAAALKSPN